MIYGAESYYLQIKIIVGFLCCNQCVVHVGLFTLVQNLSPSVQIFGPFLLFCWPDKGISRQHALWQAVWPLCRLQTKTAQVLVLPKYFNVLHVALGAVSGVFLLVY